MLSGLLDKPTTLDVRARLAHSIGEEKAKASPCPSSSTPPRPSPSCGPRRCPRTSWSAPPSSATRRSPWSTATASRGAPRFFKAARARGPAADRRRRAEPGRRRGAAAARRDAARLPQPLPADHADEGRRPEGGGAAAPRDAGGPRRGAGGPAGRRHAGRGARSAGGGAAPRSSTDRLARIVEAFGPGRVVLDVQRHRRREEEAANQALLDLGRRAAPAAVATNGVRYAAPRAGRSSTCSPASARSATLDAAGRLLAENAERHLKRAGGDGRALRRPARPPRATPRRSRSGSTSRSTTSATASPTTRCRRARRRSRSCARSPEAGARERFRPLPREGAQARSSASSR